MTCGDDDGMACAACGSCEGRLGRGRPAPHFDCDTCGTTTFIAGDELGDDHYGQVYEQGPDLAARLGRARVELLSWAGVDRSPPPRLRTSDVAVLDLLDRIVQPRGPVLDWGCGSGRLVQHLHRRGREVVGVDVVGQLVARLDEAGLSATTDGAELPDHAAVIISLELLEHLRRPGDLVALWRQRWPATPVIVSVPSPRRQPVVEGRREWWDQPPEHHIRFSPDGLQRLFDRHGYRTRVDLPGPSGRDQVPAWWKQLTATGLPIQRLLRHAPRPIRRPAAVATLWTHAGYVRTGYLLGGLRRAVTSTPAEASAESMVAVALPR